MPYTLEDFARDYAREHNKKLTPKERIEGMSPEEILQAMSPEYRKELLDAIHKLESQKLQADPKEAHQHD